MLMIPDSAALPQTQNWKDSLSTAFRSVDEFLKFCEVDAQISAYPAGTRFPFRVTRYYASLIEKGNALDPLLLQVLPDAQEQDKVNGYSTDAVGDQQAMVAPGLIHKYHGRVLLTLTSACAIHCRYCFRQHYPYSDNITDIGAQGSVMQYLSANTDISEVILSGGDPLMLSDAKLAQLIGNLNHAPHIRLLRIHSRLLSVLPERINTSFMSALKQFRGNVVFVTHINHAREISERNSRVFRHLTQAGYRIFNQSVLLARINDSVDVLAQLSYRLFEHNIIPYYLHRLDKVQGAAHFDVSAQESCRLYTRLRNRLPGYLLPRMVEEIAGKGSKTAVHCD
jgi:EF-P beta-lysylation protein EpmB